MGLSEFCDSIGLVHWPKPDKSKNLQKFKKPGHNTTDPELESEDHLHTRVATWLSKHICPAGEASIHGVCWYTVEYRAKRSVMEMALNARRGVVAGIPDIDFYWRGHAYKIELKRPSGKGRMSYPQIQRHAALRASGVKVVVRCSLEDVIKAVKDWQIPLTVEDSL